MLDHTPKTIPFTAAKYAELQADVERLTIERKAVMERLQVAREMGDLSENGAYKYAKFELGDIGRKLRTLTYQLSHGYVASSSQDGTVCFGSTVSLECKGKQFTYMLVSEYESNPTEGKLSTTSPLGTLLMGKKEGASVELDAPAGKITYTLVKIS